MITRLVSLDQLAGQHAVGLRRADDLVGRLQLRFPCRPLRSAIRSDCGESCSTRTPARRPSGCRADRATPRRNDSRRSRRAPTCPAPPAPSRSPTWPAGARSIGAPTAASPSRDAGGRRLHRRLWLNRFTCGSARAVASGPYWNWDSWPRSPCSSAAPGLRASTAGNRLTSHSNGGVGIVGLALNLLHPAARFLRPIACRDSPSTTFA